MLLLRFRNWLCKLPFPSIFSTNSIRVSNWIDGFPQCMHPMRSFQFSVEIRVMMTIPECTANISPESQTQIFRKQLLYRVKMQRLNIRVSLKEIQFMKSNKSTDSWMASDTKQTSPCRSRCSPCSRAAWPCSTPAGHRRLHPCLHPSCSKVPRGNSRCAWCRPCRWKEGNHLGNIELGTGCIEPGNCFPSPTSSPA